MPVYNKLVRDLIPQVIDKTGKQYSTRILDDKEYITELKTKLQEEMQEYLEASNDQDSIEELADLMELIHALVETHGASMEQLEEVRQEKAEKRGGFTDKIFLIEVEDD
ncbi:nucleoside triphosphate pyrophosphohydrolase [Aquibacillus koreensis]|uniref:Nucleoside triphosphate pyrophosphohydrolase n=1 Tax=Aquibacillus koreensis TaxID=279446 RepID=A0A9X3WLR0_9BACI|nr:nucleoside triphosphate pyrophosphohydrolase [Aquibacillus koreensis]MCT2534775.1 nucleoside triphosphate pyrophosphohydrolase [Aquibacillus koreensis]MDC3419614.1 nucleoside triphosphate pyrophosphohydrolase [Aquibacillus koreensis]